MSDPKKLYIKTYGCQMNVYDSERMAEALGPSGYVRTERQDEADLILLNTCHIRKKAAEKTYSELGRLRALKRERPDLRIGVTGCVAQAEGGEILARSSVADFVVGPQSYHRLPDLIGRRGAVETDFPEEDKFDRLPERPKAARGPTAFLTVQEGCDKFCAFCVVPYTRGAEVSRPADRILAEARDLVARGVREITLLGQNVNAWHGDAGGLGALVRQVAAIEGLARVRYTTSHPCDMSDDLIAAHADVDKLMPYLHLPVQSGSDRILKAMNRRHTAAEYLALIARIRAVQPDLALSGDFIVGFPGETDEDFEDTMRLVEAVGYAQAFSFKYSTRPGTPGAELGDQVPEDVKAKRLEKLQALLFSQQRAFAESCVGREIDLLLEKEGRMPGQLVGRSPWLQPVNVDAKASQIGDIIKVRIIKAGPNSLFAEMIG
jgi:tRNA-2-methylthio-N6-dimethylallyladenosine synthase